METNFIPGGNKFCSRQNPVDNLLLVHQDKKLHDPSLKLKPRVGLRDRAARINLANAPE